MFAKLLVVVLAAGSTGLGLLGLRHQRLVLAHEGLAAHQRLQVLERDLWELRGEVARMSRPTVVEQLARSLPVEWSPLVDPVEAGPDAIHRPLPAPIELPAEPGGERTSATVPPGSSRGLAFPAESPTDDDLPIDWPTFPVPPQEDAPGASPAPAGADDAGKDAGDDPAAPRRGPRALPGDPAGASPVLADARRGGEGSP